jgi:hypothetical protein
MLKTPENHTDMVIIFLSPEKYVGKTGVQRVNDHMEVVAILLDDGTDMSDKGCSYRGLNVEPSE